MRGLERWCEELHRPLLLSPELEQSRAEGLWDLRIGREFVLRIRWWSVRRMLVVLDQSISDRSTGRMP